MTHVFYHKSDNDGRASGAVIKWALQGGDLNRPPMPHTLHPLEYGDEVPEISSNDYLIFADVVPSPYEKIDAIIKRYPHLIIIDHHKSFIDWLNQTYPPSKFEGLRRIGTAACLLAWEYFMPRMPAPQTIQLLAAYDVWDHSNEERWTDRIEPFQLGMKAIDTDPVTNWSFWQEVFSLKPEDEKARVHSIIESGFAIRKYQRQYDIDTMKNDAFEATFDGYRAICCNSDRNSNAFFSVWDENKYDIMLAFEFDKSGQYRVGLYTTSKTLDVSTIAKKHGGGGHPQASGFQAKSMELRDGIIIFS
jgi:uncharacterized protein